MGDFAKVGKERIIFTLHILTELKNAFPRPIILEKHRGFESIRGFKELRLKAEDVQREFDEKARMGERPGNVVKSEVPAVTAEIGTPAQGARVAINSHGDSMPMIMEEYQRRTRELSKIWDSSIEYLQTNGDIMEIDNKFILAETVISPSKKS